MISLVKFPSKEVYDLSEENEWDTYMSREVPVQEGDEARILLHKKNLVKVKNIIVDSVRNQLIVQVSSLKTPKIFDSLTKLFEGKK